MARPPSLLLTLARARVWLRVLGRPRPLGLPFLQCFDMRRVLWGKMRTYSQWQSGTETIRVCVMARPPRAMRVPLRALRAVPRRSPRAGGARIVWVWRVLGRRASATAAMLPALRRAPARRLRRAHKWRTLTGFASWRLRGARGRRVYAPHGLRPPHVMRRCGQPTVCGQPRGTPGPVSKTWGADMSSDILWVTANRCAAGTPQAAETPWVAVTPWAAAADWAAATTWAAATQWAAADP